MPYIYQNFAPVLRNHLWKLLSMYTSKSKKPRYLDISRNLELLLLYPSQSLQQQLLWNTYREHSKAGSGRSFELRVYLKGAKNPFVPKLQHHFINATYPSRRTGNWSMYCGTGQRTAPCRGLAALKHIGVRNIKNEGGESQWWKEALKSLKCFLPCIPALLQTYPAVPVLCWQAVLTCAWKCSLNCRQASGVYHWKKRTAAGTNWVMATWQEVKLAKKNR